MQKSNMANIQREYSENLYHTPQIKSNMSRLSHIVIVRMYLYNNKKTHLRFFTRLMWSKNSKVYILLCLLAYGRINWYEFVNNINDDITSTLCASGRNRINDLQASKHFFISLRIGERGFYFTFWFEEKSLLIML